MTLAKITKANYLVEASYNLTLQEQRLILACLSKIDSRKEAQKEIELTASEYSDLMHIDIKNAHRELYKASDKLYERSIVVFDPEKQEEFRWIQKKIHYTKGDGKIKLIWSDDVLSYISQLKRRFTSYRLVDVAKLNTSYALGSMNYSCNSMQLINDISGLMILRIFFNWKINTHCLKI